MSHKNSELSKFMLNKDAEKKGHKKTKIEKEDKEDDFLPDPTKPIRQTTESPVRRDDSSVFLRKLLNILVMVPVITIGVASFAFFIFKILPPIIKFIRRLFIILMMGGQ